MLSLPVTLPAFPRDARTSARLVPPAELDVHRAQRLRGDLQIGHALQCMRVDAPLGGSISVDGHMRAARVAVNRTLETARLEAGRTEVGQLRLGGKHLTLTHGLTASSITADTGTAHAGDVHRRGVRQWATAFLQTFEMAEAVGAAGVEGSAHEAQAAEVPQVMGVATGAEEVAGAAKAAEARADGGTALGGGWRGGTVSRTCAGGAALHGLDGVAEASRVVSGLPPHDRCAKPVHSHTYTRGGTHVNTCSQPGRLQPRCACARALSVRFVVSSLRSKESENRRTSLSVGKG